jgi:hypothetical protein
VQQDVTEAAQSVVALVNALQSQGKAGQETTLIQLVDMWKGAANKRGAALPDNLPGLGRGQPYTKHDAERLMHKLVIDSVLAEHLVNTAHGGVVVYVRPGRRAGEVAAGRLELTMSMADQDHRAAAKAAAAAAAVVEKPAKKRQGPPVAVRNAIIQALRLWREKNDISVYEVRDDFIDTVAREMPATFADLENCTGFNAAVRPHAAVLFEVLQQQLVRFFFVLVMVVAPLVNLQTHNRPWRRKESAWPRARPLLSKCRTPRDRQSPGLSRPRLDLWLQRHPRILRPAVPLGILSNFLCASNLYQHHHSPRPQPLRGQPRPPCGRRPSRRRNRWAFRQRVAAAVE